MGVECESADALVRKHFDGVIGRTMLQTALHSVAKFAVLQPNKTLGRFPFYMCWWLCKKGPVAQQQPSEQAQWSSLCS